MQIIKKRQLLVKVIAVYILALNSPLTLLNMISNLYQLLNTQFAIIHQYLNINLEFVKGEFATICDRRVFHYL